MAELNDICMSVELIYIYSNIGTTTSSILLDSLENFSSQTWGARKQGELTAPKLFNIHIIALIGELGGVNCYIDEIDIGYAYDMALLSASNFCLGSTKLISLCEKCANSHGFKFNVNKHGIQGLTQMPMFHPLY